VRVGPVAGGGPVKWVDGGGAVLPAPHSRVGWAGKGTAMARASVLRIAAPGSEALLLRAQHLPPKQRPGPEALLARLADLAAIDGPTHELGARAAALDAAIAEVMALPGVAAAQAALEAGERDTLVQILPATPPAPAPQTPPPPRPGAAARARRPARPGAARVVRRNSYRRRAAGILRAAGTSRGDVHPPRSRAAGGDLRQPVERQ
jgi:hypothetical protein